MQAPVKERNRTMQLLSALGMILVVCGHVNAQWLSFGGLFPYYSFHMALFVFISGYFYSETAETAPAAYIKKKILHLLVPYFVFNLLYGVLVILLRRAGFYIGNDVSLRTLFAEPFLTGHQFGYNAPGWFVPALFLTEMTNLCFRKVLFPLAKKLLAEDFRKPSEHSKLTSRGAAVTEILLLVIYLLLGVIFCYLAGRGAVYEWRRIPGRVLYMLPFFQGGRFYRSFLEGFSFASKREAAAAKSAFRAPASASPSAAKQCLRTVREYLPCFAVIVLFQLLLTHFYYGIGAVSVVWCNGFVTGPVVPLLAGFSGITLWLLIARCLTPILGSSRIMAAIGKNTFSIMLHQIASFLLVKTVFYGLYRSGLGCADFLPDAFFTDVYYVYLPGAAPAAVRSLILLLYVLAGLFLPLLLAPLARALSGRKS